MDEIEVLIAQGVARKEPTRLLCHGLGSCIALMLHDPGPKAGGLAHILLPDRDHSTSKSNPLKFADSATLWLIDELIELGASRSGLKAKIAGGAMLFKGIKDAVGRENIIRTKETLAREGVRLVGEDVGGTRGRTVIFETHTGIARVRSVKATGLKFDWEERVL